jgi:hypothetical protein
MARNDAARSLNASLAAGLVIALAAFGPGCAASTEASSTDATASALVACDPTQLACIPGTSGFKIRAYAGQVTKNGGKCLDYASEVAGTPLIINDCALAHPLHIIELPERMGADSCARKHEVALTTGTMLVGLGQSTGSAETPLVLQAAAQGTTPATTPETPPGKRKGQPPPPPPPPPASVTMDQRFSLDGDSIIVSADRDSSLSNARVAKVQNSRGKNGSPVVVGPRELRDNELWDFHALDGSGRDPTTGFVHVPGLAGLRSFFASHEVHQCAKQEIYGPKWPDYDTVVVVDDAPILFSAPTGAAAAARSCGDPAIPGVAEILVTDGVTIRGDRRGAKFGPLLAEDNPYTNPLITTLGNDIRITGLRIDGPTRSSDGCWEATPNTGIQLREREGEDVEGRVAFSRLVVDHNDMSEWVSRAVMVDGGDHPTDQCVRPPPESSRPSRSQVSRNFLHHNRVNGSGYGVDANSGGFPLVAGNTFVSNRHAIAATNATPLTGYRARANLVLSDAPIQFDLGVASIYTHDFDIHGTGDNGFDGIAGGYTEVSHNTFLGHGDWNTWHANFKLRGMPCDKVEVHDNVFLQGKDDAVQLDLSDGIQTTFIYDAYNILKIANSPSQFDKDNPTKQLAVGDFDGDGRDDVFLATGTAWYYAPGGEAEWRLLSPDKNDATKNLLFGDFDGDGRTDVVGQNGGNAEVSWGGVGEWEYLNSVPAWKTPGGPSIKNVAVGNFDGVGGDDLFFANGEGWYLAAEGSGAWAQSQTSSFRVSDVRFGDFNGNGTTDVFSVVSGKWMFSDGATQSWAPLPVSLTSSMQGLFVADFDGNGTDDIGSVFPAGFTGAVGWRWSRDAANGWQNLISTTKTFAAFGRFRADPAAGSALLFWDDAKLAAAYAGSGGLQPLSRQDMR